MEYNSVFVLIGFIRQWAPYLRTWNKPGHLVGGHLVACRVLVQVVSATGAALVASDDDDLTLLA